MLIIDYIHHSLIFFYLSSLSCWAHLPTDYYVFRSWWGENPI